MSVTIEEKKLGRPFWQLWTASVISNLGDGIGFIAYPWLASAVTRSPLLLALVGVVQTLPWLLFSIPAGVIIDRLDRRRIVVVMDTFRGILTAIIGTSVFLLGKSLPSPSALAGGADIETNYALYFVIVACSFMLGIAEVLRDNSAQTLLPSLVKQEHLERANGRLQVVEPLMGTFVGPPVGSFLVGIAFFVPIFFDSVSFFASVALLALIPGTYKVLKKDVAEEHLHWREDLKTGLTWLWNQKFIRVLAITLALQNLVATFSGAAFILFAQEVLKTTPFTFALMSTGGAVGGILGGVMSAKIAKRFGPGACVRGAIVGIGLAQLGEGLSVHWTMFWFMTFTIVFFSLLWNVVTVSFRQRVIPQELFGRVNSVYRFISWGVIPIGSFLGGATVTLLQHVVDRGIALRMTFLIGGVLTLVIATVMGPKLSSTKFQELEAAAGDHSKR